MNNQEIDSCDVVEGASALFDHLTAMLYNYREKKSPSKTPRDIFFECLFSLETLPVETDDQLDPAHIAIPRALVESHPYWKISEKNLLFVIRSNAFDDHDVLTIESKLVSSGESLRVHPSVLEICARERDEENKRGQCRIYMPRFLPLHASAAQMAKYLYENNSCWYYGQIQDNQYHGLGMYFTPNQGVYVGEFSSNQQQGRGIHLKPSGQAESAWPFVIFCGEFVGNKRHGSGLLRDSSGFYWEVLYEKGACTQRRMMEQSVHMEAVSEGDDQPPVINITPL